MADGAPLKLLVISQYFWPESFRINQVVEDLRAEGAEVTVLTGQPHYPEGRTFPGYAAWRSGVERHPSGYEIVRVPEVPRGRGGTLRLALNYVSFILSGVVLGTYRLRGRRFDAIFVYGTSPVIQGFVGTWLRRVKRAGLVLWVQDLWPAALSATDHVKSPVLLRAVARMMKGLYRRCDLLLVQSEAFAAPVAALAGATPVRFFPNPGEHPSQGEGAPALPLGFNVIFGGNLGQAQALETVAEAAALLRAHPDVNIVLFGAGPKSGWLAAEIGRRGLTNLKLGGRLPAEAMAGVYAQASALLLTLVKDENVARTVPSKLQSYLMAGRPVIAAVEGEAARIVNEAGAGIACAAQDGQALADAILALKARSEEDRAAMGKAGRAYYEAHYDPAALARELHDCLASVARETRL